MKLITTLAAIRSQAPCEDGYRKLAKHLGGVKKYGENTPINILTILDSNGLDDALWCLRAVEGHEKEILKIACDFALQVAHLWDMPPIVRQYLETQDESIRAAARDAAQDAAWAARAARDAAQDAAWDAARDAAWAAQDAAWDAARDAAWGAAQVAARVAARAASATAWDAARVEQEKYFRSVLTH